MNTAAIETGHIRRLTRVMDEIRKIDSEIPTQMAHCLLIVALEPGITMKRMAEKLGLSQSSTSRNVSALSKTHRYGKPGYDLITAKEDPTERRRKIVTLTAKGERVMHTKLKRRRVSTSATECKTREKLKVNHPGF